MRRVVINHPKVGPFVGERARSSFVPETDHSIGLVDENDEVYGGAIYSSFTGRACTVAIAGNGRPGWMTRDFIWNGFRYPFISLNYASIWAVVEIANIDALAFDLKLGWRIHALLPEYFPSGGAYLLTMHRSECKWLTKVLPKRAPAIQE